MVSPQDSVALRARDDEWISLIKRIASGEQAALSALYDGTSRVSYGLILRIVSDPATAEEVTLDVYTQVWRRADSYNEERGSPLAWLLTIARTRALDRLRAGWQDQHRKQPLEVVSHVATSSANPEEEMALGERRQLVRSALASLSSEQREAIELAYYSGLSHSEIALKLGQPPGNGQDAHPARNDQASRSVKADARGELMLRNFTDVEIEEQTALHALGALGQHEARALESLISDGATDLAESIEVFDKVVAALALGASEATPPASLRARLLETLDAPDGSDEVALEGGATSDEEFYIVRSGDTGWKQCGDGVLIKELFVNHARGTKASLLRILPGGHVPAHRHPSIEEIFVIDGDCRINSETLGPGDYRFAQPGTSDRLLTSEQGTTVLVLGSTVLELL